MSTDFADWLKGKIRERPDLNQRKLAEALDIYASTVHYWLKGEQEPSDKNIAGLAKVLGVDSMFIYQRLGRLPPTTNKGVALTGPEEEIVKTLIALRQETVYDPLVTAVRYMLDVAKRRADPPWEGP